MPIKYRHTNFPFASRLTQAPGGWGHATGGVQSQILTPTPPPPKLFGPCGGGSLGGLGVPSGGSRGKQHTYPKMIPSLHWSF